MQANPSVMLTKSENKLHLIKAWIVVVTAAIFFFYQFIQLNFFNAINIPLMQTFHLNATELGQLDVMYFYGDILFLFPAGILLDRYSTKKILLIAVLGSIIGTFLFGLAQTYPVAAFSRFLVGSGASFCFLSCFRLASRWFPTQKMALVTGVIVTMAMLGGMVAQTPFVILSHYLGWRNTVFINASMGILIGLAILWLVQDRPPNNHENALSEYHQLKALGFWHGLRLVLTNRYNWLNGFYASLVNLPVFLLGGLWGIHYLVVAHQFSEHQASYATTLFFVGVILGSPIFGWVSDKIKRRVLPMIIGVISSLTMVLLLIYVPYLSSRSILLLFFLIGFTTSAQVLTYPTIAEHNPPVLGGTAISVASIIILGAGPIVLPLFGWLMEQGSSHPIINDVPQYLAYDFGRAMLIIPVAFVIGFIMALLIRETYCKQQRQ